jgi:hypothetical protein
MAVRETPKEEGWHSSFRYGNLNSSSERDKEEVQVGDKKKEKAIQRANIANVGPGLTVYGDTEMLNVTKG